MDVIRRVRHFKRDRRNTTARCSSDCPRSARGTAACDQLHDCITCHDRPSSRPRIRVTKLRTRLARNEFPDPMVHLRGASSLLGGLHRVRVSRPTSAPVISSPWPSMSQRSAATPRPALCILPEAQNPEAAYRSSITINFEPTARYSTRVDAGRTPMPRRGCDAIAPTESASHVTPVERCLKGVLTSRDYACTALTSSSVAEDSSASQTRRPPPCRWL